MFEIHTTREGKQMFISQMEDEHIKNTINLYIKKLEMLKGLTVKVDLPKFKKALYNIADDEDIQAEAMDKLKDVAKALYPYLAEAMLRGIDFKTELQKVFEREGKEDNNISVGMNPMMFIDDSRLRRCMGYVDPNGIF